MITHLIPLLVFSVPQAGGLDDASALSAIDPARRAAVEAERARLAERAVDEPEPMPAFDPQRVAAEALGVGELPDGGAVASGPNWSARWSDGKLRFQAVGAEPAFEALTLELELLEIVRESEAVGLALDLRGTTTLLRDEDAYSARVQRALAGGVDERWDLLPEGAELSYALDVLPPGAGDLVVRLAAETELVARQGTSDPGRGLAFFGPSGEGLLVGAVTGIDARGATCDGRLAWDGAQLELRLPASFVDTAVLPLVVDPTITNSALIPGTGTGDESPDVAWDEDTQTWAVAFKRRLGAHCPWYPSGAWHYNVLVQRLYSSGSPKGAAILLGTTTLFDFTTFTLQVGDETPDIVNINGRDEFAVVVATPTVCVPGSFPESAGSTLHVLRVRASDGFHHFAQSPSRLVSGYAMNVELGTDPLPFYPSFFIAWASRTGASHPYQFGVRAMRVHFDAAGNTRFDPEHSLASPGGLTASVQSEGLAVTPSSGWAGRWVVAWSSYDAWSGTWRIKGRTIGWDGVPVSVTTSLASSSGSARVEDPRIAGDGIGIALQYSYGGSSVWAKPVSIAEMGSLSPGTPVALPSGDGRGAHDVTQLGAGFVSVRTQNATGAHTLHATSFDAAVSAGSMVTQSRWMPMRLAGRTRLAGMGESKPVVADDQVMAVWKMHLGGVYRARILP